MTRPTRPADIIDATLPTRHQQIVQALNAVDDASCADIQRATGIPRSTVHRTLCQLHEAGLVRRVKVGKSYPRYTRCSVRTCPTCCGLGVIRNESEAAA